MSSMMRLRSMARPLLFIFICMFHYASAEPIISLSGRATGTGPSIETEMCWIFTHLQKCGGSTIKEILIDRWRPKFRIYDTTQWKAGDAFTQHYAQDVASGKEWHVVAGGYPEALRRTTVINNNCRWFTLFRHPIARMVSAIYYCRKAPGDTACASRVVNARDVDLVTFAKHWGNFALRQFALSMIPADDVMKHVTSETGRNLTARDISVTPGWYLLKMYLDDQAGVSGYGNVPDAAMYDTLIPVQDLLRDSYAAVGILEEFNTTLSLFDAALKIPGVDWSASFDRGGKKNIDSVYKREEELSLVEAWANSEIKSYLHFDLLLYEHAVDVFHQQAQKYVFV